MSKVVALLGALLLFAWAESAFGDSPRIRSLEADGTVLWREGQSAAPRVAPGREITIRGEGFGEGPDGDTYGKILVGTVRALERDLPMFQGGVHLLRQLFFEKPKLFDMWSKDILEWTDGRIRFRVPVTASRGPLVLSLQQKLEGIHEVEDPLTKRVERGIRHRSLTVTRLGPPRLSNEVPLEIDNPRFAADAAAGEAIYWAYDYNIGQVHFLRGLDWKKILKGETVDPVTGLPADPRTLFGAIPARPGEVPPVALEPHFFDPYPIPMPLKPLLRRPLARGTTHPTGYVGYVYAESIHVLTQRKGRWIGFNCASCHAQRITYEAAPGVTVTKVFPGLPNPWWSMKWNLLGDMKGVVGRDDKTRLLYAVPPGTGEHSLVRAAGDGSEFDDDSRFSPIAIPIITRHTPVRRALSHAENVAGFEGSYVHSEEPDGAIGAMGARALQQLTAYMTTLDRDHDVLERVALHRRLKRTGALGDVDGASEGELVSRGKEAYPRLVSRLERGREIFGHRCQSCHQENFGTWSDEDIYPLSEVGSYFSPTVFHRNTGGIRTALLRDLFWVEPRGLLHDGHVKSLEDLVSPDRCDETSALYRRYYTVHSGSFRIPKGTPAQERATRRHAHFTDVPWDRDHLYWDYPAQRAALGGPAAPHPWCAESAEEVSDLVLFLMTL